MDDPVTGVLSLRVSRESVRISFVGGWMTMVRWAGAGRASSISRTGTSIGTHAYPGKWGRCASPRLHLSLSLRVWCCWSQLGR